MLQKPGEYTKPGRAVIAAGYQCDGRRYHAEVWTYRARSGDWVLMWPLFTRFFTRLPDANRQEVLVEPLPGALLLDLTGECPASRQTASIAAYRLVAVSAGPNAPVFDLLRDSNPPHAALDAVPFELFRPTDAYVDAPIALRRLERVAQEGPAHPYWRPNAAGRTA